MKLIGLFCTIFLLATPALAFEIEEIGTIEATFDGETIAQPTVLVRNGDEASATASLFIAGAGVSNLNIMGYGTDNRQLILDLAYMTEQPGPQTAPIYLVITYAPQGTGQHWTSEDALTAPSLTFSTLEIDGDEGRATGAFAALLCFAEDYEAGADTGKCRPIEGRFDTRVFVER